MRRCRPPNEPSCKIFCSMRPFFVGIAFGGLLAVSPCIQFYDCACWPSIPFRPIPYTAIRTSHFVLVRPFLWVLFFVELLTVTPRFRVFRLSLSPSILCSHIPYTPSMQPISSRSGRCIRIAFYGAACCDSYRHPAHPVPVHIHHARIKACLGQAVFCRYCFLWSCML